jgi:hypothetical protein
MAWVMTRKRLSAKNCARILRDGRFSCYIGGMNTDFKPLENESAMIEQAEDALRQGQLHECRRLAEPVFRHYCMHNRPLSPAMERLFGVYVAISQGHLEARALICDAQSSA